MNDARSEYIIKNDPGYKSQWDRAPKMDGATSTVEDNESFRSIRLVQLIARPSVVDFSRPSRSSEEVKYIMKTGKTPSEVRMATQNEVQVNHPKLQFGNKGNLTMTAAAPAPVTNVTPYDSVSHMPPVPMQTTSSFDGSADMSYASLSEIEEEEEESLGSQMSIEPPQENAYTPAFEPPVFNPQPFETTSAPPPPPPGTTTAPYATDMVPHEIDPFDQIDIQENEQQAKAGYLLEIADLRMTLRQPPTTLNAESSLASLRTEFDVLSGIQSTKHMTAIGMAVVMVMLAGVERGASALGFKNFKGFKDAAITDPAYESGVRRFVRSNLAYRGGSNPLMDMAMTTGLNAIQCGFLGSDFIRQQDPSSKTSGEVMSNAMQSGMEFMDSGASGGGEPPPVDTSTSAPRSAAGAGAGNPMNSMPSIPGLPAGFDLSQAQEMMKNPDMMKMVNNFMSQPGAFDTITSIMNNGMGGAAAMPMPSQPTKNQVQVMGSIPSRSGNRMAGPE